MSFEKSSMSCKASLDLHANDATHKFSRKMMTDINMS